ncbi:serine acetyltransferase [Microbacterium betulae]|uniref:Serine acetyltransferase n=1 Tax=Microbacterium betulae TaxID=2981139 RepID=A0AA97FHY9_9MICO|nr:serine acetyltransferase [Microbacterium sp. AB]WOF22640.1 serine acetyltransferase [Microbacterium sp. AB]
MSAARDRMRDAWRADRAANLRYPKSRFVLRWLRVCQRWRETPGRVGRAAYVLTAGGYKIATEWVLGIELPPSTRVGPGLRLRHGVGVVVNPGTTIGRGVMLRHGVTLGNRRTADDCPTIEDDVEIGVGAVVIGAVTVGRGARIGPYAVVVKDVPPGAVVRSPRAEVVMPTSRPGAPGDTRAREAIGGAA